MKPFAVILLLATLSSCGSVSQEQFSPAGVQELRSLVAEQGAKINELDATLRQVTGRLEEIEHSSNQETTELRSALSRFSSRVPPPSGVPVELLSQDEQRIALNQGPAAAIYRSALQKLHEGSFSEAEKLFSQFVVENPGTTFTDNALFWSAVCFEKVGQTDRAIVQYSEVFQRFPQEDFVPAALYRLGDAFRSIQSTNDALTTYKKLVDEHPDSAWTKLAQARIAEMKKH